MALTIPAEVYSILSSIQNVHSVNINASICSVLAKEWNLFNSTQNNAMSYSVNLTTAYQNQQQNAHYHLTYKIDNNYRASVNKKLIDLT